MNDSLKERTLNPLAVGGRPKGQQENVGSSVTKETKTRTKPKKATTRRSREVIVVSSESVVTPLLMTLRVALSAEHQVELARKLLAANSESQLIGQLPEGKPFGIEPLDRLRVTDDEFDGVLASLNASS